MRINQSIERALDILECFSKEKPESGLSELSRNVGLPKATVFRLAETLVQKGYLVKNSKLSSYQLGYKILNLGNVFLSTMDYRKIALPYMRKLRDETNESVTLYISVNDRERLCVERFQSTSGLTPVVYVGDILPIDAGAAGKVLLAFRGDSGALFSGCKVTNEELETIRKQGYSISYSERNADVTSVSAPLLNQHGRVIAALAVSGPEFRCQGKWLDDIIKLTRETSRKISVELGYTSCN